MTLSAERDEEILKRLHDTVVNMDEVSVVAAANEALAEGMGAYRAIMHGLAAGMTTVGRLFEEEEYFVPEILLCAEALYAGLNVLRPHIRREDVGVSSKGNVIIGVVQGDVHDIGKNLVKIMFEVAGFTVYDLGRDVPLERFAEAQTETNAKLVALSTMMTTTMPGVKRAIEIIRKRDPHVKIMIGGAPISQYTVEEFGADGTAPNATSALGEAIRMIGTLRTLAVNA